MLPARSVLATACLGLMCLIVSPPYLTAADWPMYRYDASRTSASPQQLAPRLHLQWVRDYPRLTPAWPDQAKMQLDAVYEPVVAGSTLFLGSSRHDSLTALDTRSGAERWRFLADGPVRFAPVVWEGRVYFACDDGCLYCLDAERGTLVWKHRGSPQDRRLLGNGRLISTWPARGAPVIGDGIVYYAAGIWPFMGVFLHALDARTGKPVWTNDGDGAVYIKQPHNADSFAGVAPQGPLVLAGDRLLIPGGRSVPACYDRKTGKLQYYLLAENAKRGGGSEVAVVGDYCFNEGAAFELATGKYLGPFGESMVLDAEAAFCWASGECRMHDWKKARIETVESVDRKGDKVKKTLWQMPQLDACKLPGVETMIKAGSRVYAGGTGRLLAIDLPLPDEGVPSASWRTDVEGTVASIVAADDRLFAVTREGRLCCFGPEEVQPQTYPFKPLVAEADAAAASRARALLETTGGRDGCCIVWGAGSGNLIGELVRQSSLHIIVLEPDPEKAKSIREQLTAAGHYGERVAVHAADPVTFPLPPYLANLLIVEDSRAWPADALRKLYHPLRPYGGVACVAVAENKRGEFTAAVAAAALPNARVKPAGEWALVVREGALPGSADWTHEHADAANTRVSQDSVVKAPLGLLWFGGSSNEAILPRHGHGPQPQVIDGRILVEGTDVLRALDVYTGRVLWEAKLPGVGAFYNNTAHQPGANASGTNFISTHDAIYVAYDRRCVRLDPATGRKLGEFRLPAASGTQPPLWGYVNVVGDYLVGGADPLVTDPKLLRPKPPPAALADDPEPASTAGVKAAVAKVTTPKVDNDTLSSSKRLVVMNRHTGKVLWSATARNGFRHNAICAGGGRLYAIDRLSGAELNRLKRRGETPTVKSRLVVFDLQTGERLWQTEDDVFGTWLSYSATRDVLVESGRNARDTLSDEAKGMRAYRAATGAVLWYEAKYVGPAMIWHDTVLKDRSACDLLTGAPKQRRDPLTGELVEWTWTRNYGCNTPAASEHLLTFRSGAAGYFDLCHDGGTGNFGGFRSSCTNNLIVANGVLSAPDYTRTCVCSYQNQTSLALVPMPDAEMWTFFGSLGGEGRVRRVGLNLGAPGDRRADDGTLWIEVPSVAGTSPRVPVTLVPEKPEWFRRHSSQVQGSLPWVAASGAKGLRSLAVTLGDKDDEERAYTVRLHFLEPDEPSPGARVFHVDLQGQRVLSDLDVSKEAGGAFRGMVREFKGVRVADELKITLTPVAGAPVLCGIDIAAEGW